MRLEDLERTTEIRGPGVQTEAAPVDRPEAGPDWEGELERVRFEIDAEHKRFSDELRRHEETIHSLLERKAIATQGLSKGDGT